MIIGDPFGTRDPLVDILGYDPPEPDIDISSHLADRLISFDDQGGFRPGGPLPYAFPNEILLDDPLAGTTSPFRPIATFACDQAKLATDAWGDLKLAVSVSRRHKYDAMPLTDHPGMVIMLVAYAIPRDRLASLDIADDWPIE